jgi:drug/metabolite transporter (DMT)-like permease
MGLSALMIPVIAVVVGALFAREIFTFRDLIGAALVTGGVWFAMRQTPHTRIDEIAEFA